MPKVTIKFEGHLDQSWSDWFDGLTIHYAKGDMTVMSGRIPDRAALYGLVTKARDLGLPLQSLHLEDDELHEEYSGNQAQRAALPIREGK